MPDPFDVLRSPRRRAVLRLVWGRELAAGEVHRALGDVTFGAVSQHLRALEAAGFVVARRDGRRRLYRAVPEAVGPLRFALEAMWDDALQRLRDEAMRADRASRRAPKEPANDEK
ncbi:MAG: winged helix-turn-helix domain-containing protein [Planctomycetota bacterium]